MVKKFGKEKVDLQQTKPIPKKPSHPGKNKLSCDKNKKTTTHEDKFYHETIL